MRTYLARTHIAVSRLNQREGVTLCLIQLPTYQPRATPSRLSI